MEYPRGVRCPTLLSGIAILFFRSGIPGPPVHKISGKLHTLYFPPGRIFLRVRGVLHRPVCGPWRCATERGCPLPCLPSAAGLVPAVGAGAPAGGASAFPAAPSCAAAYSVYQVDAKYCPYCRNCGFLPSCRHITSAMLYIMYDIIHATAVLYSIDAAAQPQPASFFMAASVAMQGK